MLYFVYELVDPRTDEVRYVGITANPSIRLRQHILGYKATGVKLAWLQELRDAAVKPVMRILEKVTTWEEVKEREKHWIRKYTDQGYNLVNVQHSKMSCQVTISTNQIAQNAYHVFVSSFEENGETWLCATRAFKNWRGTRVFDLAEEYGLPSQIRGRTTYYRQSDLPAFVKWTRAQYQYPPDIFRH